jgi:hypothetical protein
MAAIGAGDREGAGMNRFGVQKVTLVNESEGPDYYSYGEFQVTDTSTGLVVARFPWSLEEPYLTNANYSGPNEVRISDDGTEAIATSGVAESRVLLPVEWEQIVVDGVALSPQTDYAALAREVALRDGPVQPGTGFREPGGQWLKKLFERLGSTPEARALAMAMSELLSDDLPRARAEALRFYEHLPDAPGAERIVELLRHQRHLFPVSEKGWCSGTTLDQDVTRVLGQRLTHVGVDRRSLVLARREALRHGSGRGPLLSALVERDGAWVRRHAIAIARVPERRWQQLLSAFESRDLDNVGEIAARIVSAGIASRADVLAYTREHFRGYGAGAIEQALRD